MKVFGLLWHLTTLYVFAENEEEALKKIRDNYPRLKREEPKIAEMILDPPDHIDSDDVFISHYGWD